MNRRNEPTACVILLVQLDICRQPLIDTVVYFYHGCLASASVLVEGGVSRV